MTDNERKVLELCGIRAQNAQEHELILVRRALKYYGYLDDCADYVKAALTNGTKSDIK